MYHNRLIPCLLLRGQRLIKTQRFGKDRYLGDPLNAVKIFNAKEVDELIFLDIDATRLNREPDFSYLTKIAQQCFMPLCYGGGIKKIDDIKKLFEIGIEKVSLNSTAYRNVKIIEEASRIYGMQSIVGAMDVKKDFFGKKRVYIENGKRNVKEDPVQYAKRLEMAGVGEIFLNSIDYDGMMGGYDYEMIQKISESVNVPVISCGGARNLEDCNKAIQSGASAAAAGSMFVYWGRNKAVLINYPEQKDIIETFENI